MQIVEIQDIAKFLINPLLYVLTGLILLMLLKKHRLKIALLLGIYFYCIGVTFTGQVFSKVWKEDDTFNPDITYDAVIVTAGVTDPRWYINRRNLPYIPANFFSTIEDSDRVFAGIQLVKSGHAKLLLFGEWIHDSYNEVEVVKKLAAGMGLKENQIHIYGQVKRTLNEAEGIKSYVEKHPVKTILLITSQHHMRRALAMFRKQGLNPDVFSVNKEEPITWESFVPDVDGIVKTQEYLYEVIGYISYYVKGDL
ncbi:MAG: hypothetical protein A2158_00330 [Chloroflexi bacterium RBG_13_46_14]|nr:MAG: hypothetical protein A2158_00330 [Chloroflexi bacterium RBG_13_46_14]